MTITSSKGFAYTASLTPLGQGTELTLTVKDLPHNPPDGLIDAVARRL